MLATILAALLFWGALLSWLYTLLHWVRALGHRRPDVSLAKLLVNGMASFDEGNFTEAGHVHVRSFRRGFVAFFCCVLLGVVVVVANLARRERPTSGDAGGHHSPDERTEILRSFSGLRTAYTARSAPSQMSNARV
jgi:hypothetical protein